MRNTDPIVELYDIANAVRDLGAISEAGYIHTLLAERLQGIADHLDGQVPVVREGEGQTATSTH